MRNRCWARICAAFAPLILVAASPAPVVGPVNARFIPGGVGISRTLVHGATVLRAGAPFTLSMWVAGEASVIGPVLLASVGLPVQSQARMLGLDPSGRVFFSEGQRHILTAPAPLQGNGPHHVALTYDGVEAMLFVDGVRVARLPYVSATVPDAPPPTHWDVGTPQLPRVDIAPVLPGARDNQHFAGRIADFRLTAVALSPAEVATLASSRPDWDRIAYDPADKAWPVQSHQQIGQNAPQAPDTLPVSRAAPSAPVAQPAYAGPTLQPQDAHESIIAGGWKLVAANDLTATGERISQPGFGTAQWLPATVPGTVLTTLVDRGRYPDPAFGLNNLNIPESLARQDWWYRTEIDGPGAASVGHTELVFNGINYAAEIWLNGQRLGAMTGAFIRGRFDVTGKLCAGSRNAIAIRIAPPPHPGIPNEESIKGGSGWNGGMMMLDGPTFSATEGWDWIPGVRDRNSGLWQDVRLRTTGAVQIVDPQVVTTLPLPDRSHADISIAVTLTNQGTMPVAAILHAGFDDVTIAKAVTLAPGTNNVRLSPSEFAALHVAHPRLWWPNGYGEAALHDLALSVDVAGVESDAQHLRFGIREITYELSAFDTSGVLRRVEIAPAKTGGAVVIDGDHDHIHESARGWAVSLHPGAEHATGVATLPESPLSPFLVVRVNGVRIAIRGGAWGMDDFMKRVGRDRLEPYFRLNRDAHMNLLRNWMGQDTESVLYDLADEYGLLVWNDFWESTQDWNLETDKPELFLKNAADVITRFRNHPSIMIWVGRNEGVPQPYLNERLAELVRNLDGTRYYTGSSNQVNLQISGPYNYREPARYFDEFSKGFAVEVGTPSFSTLESFQASMAVADQWPLSDAWVYHDWHQDGNGDARIFERSMAAKFGPATSLPDFERKAQMLNYESHRAIFEGLNAGLWRTNAGRILWMTQPAWPSNMWQTYSSDYDTHASYYGAMKASEPLHIQLNADNNRIAVVSTAMTATPGLRWRAKVTTLDNRLLTERQGALTAVANGVSDGPILDLMPFLARGPVLVKLSLTGPAGHIISDNLYWRAASDADFRAMSAMPVATVTLSATSQAAGKDTRVTACLANDAPVAALATKLTLLAADGSRVLPAYYSDNYISLLPGETRNVTIDVPANVAAKVASVALRGWNTRAATATVKNNDGARP